MEMNDQNDHLQISVHELAQYMITTPWIVDLLSLLLFTHNEDRSTLFVVQDAVGYTSQHSG